MNKNREVENSAARWKGNSRMWTAWNNQLLWIDFKVRWLTRFHKFCAFWRDLKSDVETERRKYVHPAG